MAALADGKPDIVVIGASAGGVEALTELVAALPPTFAPAVFVVLHVPPTGSVLPQILTRAGRLPASHADDGAQIAGGAIFVAPPDCHLLVEDTTMRVVRGPKENGHRPAIDPLFRTAAARHGRTTTGIILSGSLDDGTAGLGAIKSAGGTTIVQDPEEAAYPAMPISAIDVVGPDYIATVERVAELLRRGAGPNDDPTKREEEEMSGDPQREGGDSTQLDPAALAAENARVGQVSSYTCPECGGALWEYDESGIVKLRCRVGHTYTEDAYDHDKTEALEAALWTAMTALVERADFYTRLRRRLALSGQELSAQRYADQAAAAVEQAEQIRGALMELGSPIADADADADADELRAS